tara:strand:+ start:242 stop:433 length:192 start_codon:yes stop_codon:yes gene_type:complete
MAKKPVQGEWIAALVEAAEDAVLGYEQYLLDKVNYRELAQIMTKLKGLLPVDGKPPNAKKKEK